MKRTLNEIAELTSKNLTQTNVSKIARTVWIELQSNKKFDSLDELLSQVRKSQAKKSNSKIAEISSAIELSDQEKNELLDKIEKKIQSKILPVFKIDENLLGGIKIKVEDELLDLSWRGKLQQIQAKLEGNYE